jgi:DNA-binding IclR family transcriptional regulator
VTTTFDRGLALLHAVLAAELGPAGYPGNAHLAEQVGLDQTQVSRMLKDLAAVQLVERDEQIRGWRVGPRYFALAEAAGDRQLLVAARPLLRGLVARWHEPAWLSVRSQDTALTVEAQLSHWSSNVAANLGARLPIWCTGAGRALLLDHSEAELGRLLTDVDFIGGGPRAARDTAALARYNAAARAAGVVIADREFEHDVVDFSAPVRDESGGIVAAVSLAVPRFRLADRAAEVAASVREAAQVLEVRAASRAARTGDRPGP